MKIIYAEDNKLLLDIKTAVLESMGFEVLGAENGQVAWEFFSLHRADCIISDFDMPIMNGGELYKKVRSSDKEVPFFFITSLSIEELNKVGFVEDDRNFYLKKPFGAKIFREAISKLLITKGADLEEFVPVKLSLFDGLRVSNVDVYLSLSENKKVKLISAGSLIEKNFFNKFDEKDISHMYVRKNDIVDFYNLFLEKIFVDEAANSLSSKVYKEALGVKVIHSLISSVGIKDSVITSIDKLNNNVVERLKKNNKLKELIESFQNSEGFSYSHSLIISYLSNAILKNTKWDNSTTYEKLTTAAIVHDVALANSELVELHELHPIESDVFNYNNREFVKNHGAEVSKLLDDSNISYQDIMSIVSQHHERPDGSGYPKKLSASNILPLASVFILAEDLTCYLWNGNFKTSLLEEFVKEKKDFYKGGHFEEAFLGLEKIVNIGDSDEESLPIDDLSALIINTLDENVLYSFLEITKVFVSINKSNSVELAQKAVNKLTQSGLLEEVTTMRGVGYRVNFPSEE